MKLWILPLLALCLLLCACGAEANAPTEDTPVPTTAETASIPEPTPEQPTPTPEPEELPTLVISEVMAANGATIADEDGSFPDWVEVQNLGGEPVKLVGLTLRCSGKAWTLPDEELAAGEYTVFFCSEEKTGFGISREGEMLSLCSARGTEIDALQLPALERDTAWTREADVTLWPTPGYENTPAGYEEFQQTRTADGLAIGETIVYAPDGDWMELCNNGEEPVQLADYFLSDKGSERLLGKLPEKELGAGERYTVALEDLGFSLNALRDELYLSKADGTLVDYVSLHSVPIGGSVGRMTGEGGFFYFAVPSPGKENEEGFRRVSARPESTEPDGVFADVDDVTVTLSAPGEIRYTTDGSCPTAESELYTEPIVLTQTGVVRAISIEKDALPSRALTCSYILNEGHTLPVVSMVCEPWEINTYRGIYKQPTLDRETSGAVEFFDGDQRFAADCGIKLHGATSRLYMEKKSFKLSFRNRYGGDLHYDLFDNGVDVFSSILLRSPQEPGGSSLIRDSLLHELAAEAFPSLPVQDSRYAVVYINGQYWGVYSIREAHSAAHFANHNGLDESQVVHKKGNWPEESGFENYYRMAVKNYYMDDETYRQVTEHVDIDSVIGWTIIQAFCGNTDGHCDNMRFYYSYADDKVYYALVDLDHGLESYLGFSSPFGFGYRYNALAEWLLRNETDRKEFFRQLEAALEGPLDLDYVIERIDEMAAELRPEMERDRERWNFEMAVWERLVEHNKDFLRYYPDRKKYFVFTLAPYIGGTAEYKAWLEENLDRFPTAITVVNP